MKQEISKEDLFRKIDTLKIKCFDTEDALKSAETRIQELNKCNDYANEEVERLNNIINELEEELFIKKEFYERELAKRPKNDSEYNTQYADSCALAQISVIYDKLQELKGSDKE